MLENTYNKETMMKYLEVQRKSVLYSQEESSEDSCSRPRRARRCRTQFDQASLEHLEAMFAVERYPDIHLREKIAQDIGVPEARVQTWFQNKRSRSRRVKVRTGQEVQTEAPSTTTPGRSPEAKVIAPIPTEESKSPKISKNSNGSDRKLRSRTGMSLPVREEPYSKVVSSSVATPTPIRRNHLPTTPVSRTSNYLQSPFVINSSYYPIVSPMVSYSNFGYSSNISPVNSTHSSPTYVHPYTSYGINGLGVNEAVNFPPKAHTKSSAHFKSSASTNWMTSTPLPAHSHTSHMTSDCQEAPLNLTTGSPSSSGYDSPDSPLNVCD